MKKVLTITLVLTMLFGVFSLVSFGEETLELLAKESTWECLVFEEDPDEGLTAEEPENWLTGATQAGDDWQSHQAPFTTLNRYSNAIANTKFDYNDFSAFIRTKINIADPSAITELTLSVIYDENPTIYVNGTEVWSTTGYFDGSYRTFNLSDHIDAFVAGENIICVKFSNVAGGALFDMALTASVGEISVVDEDGIVKPAGASATGFQSFGALNDPSNVLDMNQNTVTGSGFNGGVEQSVTVTFKGIANVDYVFVQCKDEGSTSNEDGSRGTYHVYLYCGDVEYDLGTLPAMTGTDGGATIRTNGSIPADSVKVVIESWQGDCWACVADIQVHGSEYDPSPETPTEPTETPVEPTETPVAPTETPVAPTETPVEPTEPPVDTGDNTAFFMTLALIALIGAAVVASKKVYSR